MEEEGTASTFRALEEVFGRHGLPLSLYTDRDSHYFHTATAGGAVDRAAMTQIGRALAHLGVEHIAAYSPQARSRSERGDTKPIVGKWLYNIAHHGLPKLFSLPTIG